MVSLLPLCWLLLMAVHELGHVVAAWTTGGTVTKVVLHPLEFSRTDVDPNPRPLLVVWAGPWMGVLAPLLLWLGWNWAGLPGAYLARFFAGFCLIANAAYIGLGSLEGVGDAGEMLRHGTPVWLLWLFGGTAAAVGLRLWHGQGHHFGLGSARGRVDAVAAYGSLTALVLFVVLAMLFSSRC